MKSVVKSLFTFLSMAFCLSWVKGLFFCLTGLVFGSIFSQLVITSRKILGMSVGDQANISAFAFSRSISRFHFGSLNHDPIETIFIRSASFKTTGISCSASSPLSSFSLWSSLSIVKGSLDLMPSVEC